MELIIILLIAVEVVIVCAPFPPETVELAKLLPIVSHQGRSGTVGHIIPPQTR